MSVASRRERERKERRNAIIDAARAVFLRKGYGATTMDEIASEAELSKGTLYLYFKSKDSLFVAMSSEILAEVTEVFKRESAVTERPASECLRAMLTAYARIGLAHAEEFRVAVGWMGASDEVDTEAQSFKEHRETILGLMGLLVAVIERGQKDRSVAAGEPFKLAGQLWAGVAGALLFRLNCDQVIEPMPQPVDFEDFVDRFVDLMCDGLRPREK
jgi:AcrR family transcriptional regulator